MNLISFNETILPVSMVDGLQAELRAVELCQANNKAGQRSLLHIDPLALVVQPD